MRDLGKRCLVACVLIPAILLTLRFAHHEIFQYAVLTLFMIASCIAIWEYEQFVKEKGGRFFSKFTFFSTLLIVLSFFLSAKFGEITLLPLIAFFISFLGLFTLHLKEKEGAIVDLAVNCFGFTYVVIPIAMILYSLFVSGSEDGRIWVGYLFLVTKIADVGAYFAGNLFGRRKLAPSISPGKTIEGMVFGLVSSLLASIGFYYLNLPSYGLKFHLTFIESCVFGILFGLIGPLGDLSESLLKRDANKKDSNRLPGFGGVLDIVDSLLFTSPILYIYLNFGKI